MHFRKPYSVKKLLFSAFVLLVLAPISTSFAISGDECEDIMDQEIERITDSLDENKMKEIILDDFQFKEITHSKKIEFDNIIQNWIVPGKNCIPILENNQVKFNLNKGTENHKIASVFLDPNNGILNILIDDPPVSHGSAPINFDTSTYEESDSIFTENDDQLTIAESEDNMITFDEIGIVVAIASVVSGAFIFALILCYKK